MRWLHLFELVRSGVEVHRSKQQARYAEPRQALAARSRAVYHLDCSPQVNTDTFVVDYLADTADGFDATYAMARCVTGANLPEVNGHQSRRADLLIFGGDEVYPIGTVEHYNTRLKAVFDLADTGEPRGYVAAIPGNHDWYHGGIAFLRNFAEAGVQNPKRWTGPAVVPVPNRERIVNRFPFQSRTYFAVRLPHRWWLWGIDISLDAYLDPEQRSYFHWAREQVGDGDRVIVCTARPAWTDPPSRSGKVNYQSNRGVLVWFVNEMFGNDEGPDPHDLTTPPDWLDHVRLLLSGDRHHYVRYRQDPGQQKTAPAHLVTCGGGGAYLSSTHHAENQISVPWHLAEPGTTYTLECAYPPKEVSRGELSRRWWRIPMVNWPVTPTMVAALTAWLAVGVLALVADVGAWGWLAVPLGVVALLTLVLAVRFAPQRMPRWRQLMTAPLLGVGHALGYLIAAAAAVAVVLVVTMGGVTSDWSTWSSAAAGVRADWPALPVGAGVAVLVAGSLLVFAGYWRVADSDLVGWHENEFFAGMRLEGYKSFMRLEVHPPLVPGAAGQVAVTVFGVPQVPSNRSRSESLADPDVEIVDTFTLAP